MRYPEMRAEVRDYYANAADARAAAFCEKTLAKLDALAQDPAREKMTVMEQKALQYRVIAADLEPVLFRHSPFYYETGTMAAICDGAREFRGHKHAGGWVYWRNYHYFKEVDPELYKTKKAQAAECLYLICGPFDDTSQHFGFNHRPFLTEGVRGVCGRVCRALEKTEDPAARDFLLAAKEGLLALKTIAEKFAARARDLSEKAENEAERAHFSRIAAAADHCPWEPPATFFEALNLLAFCRKAIGTLEGIGVNSFGRVDLDLYPFYKADLGAGRLTKDEAFDLIARFLVTFDLHYDHDMKMVAYADHELENTYTLGGCDADGNPVFNDLTEMFLRAAREEKVIYPKIKARFGQNSPKAYLDEIDRAVIAGTSTALYQNDDATIPAFLRAGRPLSEARDYIVSGCWDVLCPAVEKPGGGNYLNILKAFELSVHNRTDKMAEVGLTFAPIDGAADFEEVYRITLENIRVLLAERVRIAHAGRGIWEKVDALPLFSSAMADCIEKGRDYVQGGARCHDEHYYCLGLPNVVDSLLAIKTLCFDQKKYTLAEFLAAVRADWKGNERMRVEAMHCPGWGDGGEASSALAARFNADLCRMYDTFRGPFGGKVLLGHLTYTEIRWWGEKTLATPDGRHAGDYISQGLTPSRLKRIPAVSSVIRSLAALDGAMMGCNSVVNIILPQNRMTLDVCEGFLRAAANSALQCLQLNCTTKEQLLDAQKHPENYPDLIVRVCGFSAKFTSLSPEWQNEVLTRNFYE